MNTDQSRNGSGKLEPFLRAEVVEILHNRSTIGADGHLWWKRTRPAARAGHTHLLGPKDYVPVWVGGWATMSSPGDDVFDVSIRYTTYLMDNKQVPVSVSRDVDAWPRALMTLDSNPVSDSFDMVTEQLTALRLAGEKLMDATQRTVHPSVAVAGFGVTDHTAGGYNNVDVAFPTIRDLAANSTLWRKLKPIAVLDRNKPSECPEPVLFVAHPKGNTVRNSVVDGKPVTGFVAPLYVSVLTEREKEVKLYANFDVLPGMARKTLEDYLWRVYAVKVDLLKHEAGLCWSCAVGFTPASLPEDVPAVSGSHVPPMRVSRDIGSEFMLPAWTEANYHRIIDSLPVV